MRWRRYVGTDGECHRSLVIAPDDRINPNGIPFRAT